MKVVWLLRFFVFFFYIVNVKCIDQASVMYVG